ncbi:hypothetical protein MRB53_016760 [Persea americana]|uniref:Uncharacterized protein n=1 Tax=Persea americana TaxID=3435 RepID=A0ACC2M370_PERAE|nr:hypothetical protein MRB53_016760 [Persea americana]
MASCDDDFSLLGDDSHHHHHHHHHHHTPTSFGASHHPRFAPKPSPSSLHHIPNKKPVGPADHDDDYGDPSAFCSHPSDPKFVNPCFDGDPDPDDAAAAAAIAAAGGNPFGHPEDDGDPDRKGGKRKDRCGGGDDLSDDGMATPFKKSKTMIGSGSGGGDYRKDREEWSDSAIGCLLDAYMEKFMQLNRGNLRGRDWVEVAATVSERADHQKSCCDKQRVSKSVEQCKNKMDNLKKRYKVELQRMTNGSVSVSHWTWFKKMELIVGSSAAAKASVSDEDKSVSGPVTIIQRQTKRYAVATPSPVGIANNMKTKSLSNPPRWRRVVFKISGAALAGNDPQNVDPKVTMLIAREVAMANRLGVEVAIVVGGRNFFCADTWLGTTSLDRAMAYQIGMMATVMNSILLQASLEKLGVQTRVQTSFTMHEIAEPYMKRKAIRHLEKGRVVIFGGVGAGLGNQLFITDTAAALRALEINADVVLKGTNVDGVYDCQSRNGNNVTFEHISFRDCATRGFSAMDMTAMSMCEENGIPVVIFNLLEPGNISRALCGDQAARAKVENKEMIEQYPDLDKDLARLQVL